MRQETLSGGEGDIPGSIPATSTLTHPFPTVPALPRVTESSKNNPITASFGTLMDGKRRRGDKGQSQAGDRGLSTEERSRHRGTRDSNGDRAVTKLSPLESEAGFAGTAADRERRRAHPWGKNGSEALFEV